MVPVNEILSYTPEQWSKNQPEIVDRIVSGREQMGLDLEWVAGKAGYSIDQYRRLENGERFVELFDFLRIGEVFYKYQESLLPPYKQQVNKLILWARCLPYQFQDWMDRISGP